MKARRKDQRPFPLLNGRDLIAKERRRQIEEEGYTPFHDALHGADTLRRAALAYLAHDPTLWPWERSFYKPTDPLADTVKAGALFTAALEVVLRGGPSGASEGYLGERITEAARRIDCLLDRVREMVVDGT